MKPSAVCSVVIQAGLVPAIAAISSADSGTFWRWAITAETFPSTCSRRPSPVAFRSASSWAPRIRLMPAERERPNSRATSCAATAENSSISTVVGIGRAWRLATSVTRSLTIAAASICESSARRSASSRK